MKKISLIFFLSFVLNLLWENAHSLLYASYRGAPITEFILVRASLGDALILTLLSLLFIHLSYFKKIKWLIIPIGILIAILIELYALQTGRWAYNTAMPIIPFLNVGLTPAIQLGVLGYVVYVILL